MNAADERNGVLRLDVEELDVETLVVDELENTLLEISEGPGCQVNYSCGCASADWTNCLSCVLGCEGTPGCLAETDVCQEDT